jgi:hypothetical protein
MNFGKTKQLHKPTSRNVIREFQITEVEDYSTLVSKLLLRDINSSFF